MVDLSPAAQHTSAAVHQMPFSPRSLLKATRSQIALYFDCSAPAGGLAAPAFFDGVWADDPAGISNRTEVMMMLFMSAFPKRFSLSVLRGGASLHIFVQ